MESFLYSAKDLANGALKLAKLKDNAHYVDKQLKKKHPFLTQARPFPFAFGTLAINLQDLGVDVVNAYTGKLVPYDHDLNYIVVYEGRNRLTSFLQQSTQYPERNFFIVDISEITDSIPEILSIKN